MRARSSATALVLGAWLLGPRAAAAAQPQPVHVQYSAPSGCPSQSALVATARQMGGTFREARPGEPARLVDVVVQRAGRGFSGTVVVRDLAGRERARTVRWDRCDSVVKALGLLVAMSLSDDEPPPESAVSPTSTASSASLATSPAAADHPSPAPGSAPAGDDRSPRDDPGRLTEQDLPDASGGVAAWGLWNRLDWNHFGFTLTGVAAMAVVDHAGTRLGVVGAVEDEPIEDPEYGPMTSRALARAHGTSLRVGAVAGWGAPWSRTDWFGFVAEAGLRGGVVDGAVWSLSNAGTYCQGTWATPGQEDGCISGPGSATTWFFLSPYVAGTLVFQIMPRLPVRPFVGLTALWSGDYKAASTASYSLNLGVAWRSW